MQKTAIVIGATGLIGSNIVNQLVENENYSKIKVFARKKLNFDNEKIELHIIDFEKIEDFKNKINGDELFSALGTTLKQAGGKENEYRVDFTYQYNFAKAAAENGVKDYFLVSSAGANEKSKIFYSRMKGELEREIKKLNFRTISIMQPSILVGERYEKRTAEVMSAKVMRFFCKIIRPLRKYRPIEGKIVAKAMINLAYKTDKPSVATYSYDRIFTEAE